jgi:hypothetical protein
MAENDDDDEDEKDSKTAIHRSKRLALSQRLWGFNPGNQPNRTAPEAEGAED